MRRLLRCLGLWTILPGFLLLSITAPALAKGGHGGGHGGGHAHAAPRPSMRMPRMPRPSKPRMPKPRPSTAHAKTLRPSIAHHTTTHTATNGAKPQTTARHNMATRSTGTGSTRAYTGRYPHRRRSSGHGYYGRNRYAGMHRYNRALVSQLRSVHRTLTRIDHDYKGHRARAAQHVSRAIRVLSHSSSGYMRTSMRTMNNRGKNQGGNRGRMRMSQAQSDSLMNRSLQRLQTIGSHMMSQSGTTRHGQAVNHVQMAARELHTALTVR